MRIKLDEIITVAARPEHGSGQGVPDRAGCEQREEPAQEHRQHPHISDLADSLGAGAG